MFELVEIKTDDNLLLQGLFISPHKNKPTMIYIHGWEGNFYQNRFINHVADKLAENGYGFLSIRTRSSDLLSELMTTEGSWVRTGSWLQKLEDAHIDISAAIDFLKSRDFNDIILSGHSLGTMKAVRYLFEGKHGSEIKKLVLISPFDNGFIKYAGSEEAQAEKLKIARKMIDEGKALEFVPDGFAYTNMSWQTFASWGNLDDMGKIWYFSNPNYCFPVLDKIKIPVKAVIGSKDEHVDNKKEAMNIISKHINDFGFKIIDGALHSYWGYEKDLANVVLEFVK